MRFDWYESTVSAHPDEVIADLMAGLGGSFNDGKGRNGYSYGCSIVRDDEKLCEVWWGGHSQKDTAHVVASGAGAHAFAEFMRKLYPVHAVTRCDICTDWDEPGLYDKIVDLAIPFADRHGITHHTIAPQRRGEILGRTHYFGAGQSVHQMRVYEKGLEQRQKGCPDASPHWVRVESQIRPQKKPMRLQVAQLSPLDLVGVSPFGREVWSSLLGWEHEALMLHQSLSSEPERALDHMAKQYAKPLALLYAASGSSAASFAAVLLGRVLQHRPDLFVPTSRP